MSDLTERLLKDAETWAFSREHDGPPMPFETLMIEAAARIEALEAELERAREALRGVITWDAARGFPVPYRVRDPIHACLVEGHPATGEAE